VSRRIFSWVFTSAFVIAVVTGCAGRQDTPPPQADAGAASDEADAALVDALRARLGQLPCGVADLLVRLQSEQGEAVLFSLVLRLGDDGRLRLSATKANVPFGEALLGTDQRLSLWLVQDNLSASGTLPETPNDGNLPLIITSARLLASELRDGPLPAGSYRHRDASTLLGREPATGLATELTLGADGLPTAKRLLNDQGQLVLELTYSRYLSREGQESPPGIDRPSRWHLTLAGNSGEATVRLSRLLGLPQTDERLRLEIPGNATVRPLAELLDRLR